VQLWVDLLFMFGSKSPRSDWRCVMPANWDHFQYLTDGRIEWPTGPITGLNAGDVPLWVDAWVVQAAGGGEGSEGAVSEGPSQSTSHSPSWSGWTAPYPRWTADVAGWANGQFTAGQFAMGISVLALRNGTHQEYEWWFQPIFLQ
jgi:hypothetical protein